MNKIIIFGFPHSGTTILRKIIGQAKNSFAYEQERKFVHQIKKDFDFTCVKWPHYSEDFFNSTYDDYLKFFIIRDPMYVFSSLKRRKNNQKKTSYH